MTKKKKKLVLHNLLWRFLLNFLQFGVPLNGSPTWILASQNSVPFFSGFEVDIGDYWKPGYCSTSLSMGSELATCVQDLPLRLISFQISILHKITLKLNDVAECICGHLGALCLHCNIKENRNLPDLCLNTDMACVPAGWQDRSRSETDWYLKPGCLEDGWKSSPWHRDRTWTLCSSSPTFFCRSTRHGSWL